MSADPACDSDWSQQARAALAATDEKLSRRFDDVERIDHVLALRARAVDHLLGEAWRRCFPEDVGLSLFAVGGYGRGELFPHSDVDVLVLGDSAAQQRGHEALARCLALVWDVGLKISHAVRSPQECTEAAEDQTVLTALIEARPLIADEAAIKALAQAVSPDQVWAPREFFAIKREEMRLRHARFGDTSDNLEPDIKDGPGGLRDLHTLGWMALRTFGVRDLEALVGMDQLGQDEAIALARERRVLGRLRYGLHLVAGRPEERLRFDYQKTLAARLGYADAPGSLAVEQMMQGFYRSAAIVRRISDRLLQRFEEQFEGEAVPRALDEAFELRRNYLAASSVEWPQDIGDVFALFAIWAAQPQVSGLHSQTARALAEALPHLPAYTAATVEQRAQFLALMRGPRAVDTLARMARLGVLSQWLPAFARVSGRMQFDLFHVYTVDQHTLMVLRNLSSFSKGRADERFSIAHEVWPRLRKPELLLLAGLFHDIAKGRGGDHSELGAVDAREFCHAHGLNASDTSLITWLVEQHLRMSVTAQKQDIADPEVIHRFATLIGDREHLDYLYLLTCADIAGTSPKLWNAWKDRLLADLYFATRRVLREGLEQPMAVEQRVAEGRDATHALMLQQGFDGETIARQFAEMPIESFMRFRPEQLAWQAGALVDVHHGQTLVQVRHIDEDAVAMEVFVHSPDRDGLFAAILATLDRLGFGIHQARVLVGPHGTAFDTFEILPADSYANSDPALVGDALRRALEGALDQVRVSQRTVPRQLRHFRFPPRFEFGNTLDGRYTVLELVAPDRPGLLAQLAQVLRLQRLRVHDARIATFGERAEDVFHLSDEADEPLTGEERDALRDALRAKLETAA
ncbi:[protein-PII] uridylyltransferase [Pseudoxanthomonas sp. GM95]|uniref:[protein-PII] uridylyltransferase n=1 Tax=Pseudoxanthomonas sp. GM95 TaxID=1881043 RepID=UPI000B84B21E|nr:[protein-PII] uridylyltransferase [Pseudoxanthomonas sp. GM95]